MEPFFNQSFQIVPLWGRKENPMKTANPFLPTITFIYFLCHLTSVYSQIHVGPAQPYSNIQAAVPFIQPGDTVYLHAGSYQGYQWITGLNGTSSQWITITRYQNDLMDISGGWQFVSCSFLRFEYLNFKANSSNPGRLFQVDNGGSCAAQSHHIVVDSCYFSDVTGSFSSFKYGGVDTFEVTRCVFKNISGGGAFDFNSCRSGIIRENRIENCITGGHIKGGGRDIVMERNIFLSASVSTWVAFEIGGDTGPQYYCPNDTFEVKNILFYSNLIAGGYRGLALSSARECKVINNTFYNCGQATLRFLNTSTLYPSLRANIIENNIFAFGSSAYINGSNGSPQPASAASFSNNIYYSIINSTFNGPYWDSPALDAIKDPNPINYGSGTVIFTNASGNDFHLAAGSPAIAAGKAQTDPAVDYYGYLFNSMRSIGAAEYNSTPAEIVYTLSENAGIVISPNPTTGKFKITNYKLQVTDMEIYNVMGEEISHPHLLPNGAGLNANSLPSGGAGWVLDLASQPDGIYFLKMKMNEGVIIKKIIVSK